jgi:hypothetical protein
VCDNVVNYEVVLASGEIINANSRENHDLWIALKGGGNNLGIVTRFDLRTFEQGPVYGGSIYYFGPSLHGQIDALVDEIKKPDATNETHFMISTGFAGAFGNQIMCQNQLYYTQAVDRPAVLEPFTSVQPQIDQLNSMRLKTLPEAAKEQQGNPNASLRCVQSLSLSAMAASLACGEDF